MNDNIDNICHTNHHIDNINEHVKLKTVQCRTMLMNHMISPLAKLVMEYANIHNFNRKLVKKFDIETDRVPIIACSNLNEKLYLLVDREEIKLSEYSFRTQTVARSPNKFTIFVHDMPTEVSSRYGVNLNQTSDPNQQTWTNHQIQLDIHRCIDYDTSFLTSYKHNRIFIFFNNQHEHNYHYRASYICSLNASTGTYIYESD